MPLQSSGQISLNEIHIEAGGTSGTACNINESDIRGLISASSGAAMDFADWYGASASQNFTTVKSGHARGTYTGGRGATRYGFTNGYNAAAGVGTSTPPSGDLSNFSIVVSGTTLGLLDKVEHRTTANGRSQIRIDISGTNSNSGWTTATFVQGADSFALARTDCTYSYTSGNRIYVSPAYFIATSPNNSSSAGSSGRDSAILGPGTGNSAGTGTESSFTTTLTFT